MRLLDAYAVDPAGRHAVVIGRSPILGKPIGMLLLARDATVTYCHSRTEDLPAIVRTADIVVAAVGRPHFVRGDWIKPGAVVMDAGYNDGNVGDVAFSEVVPVARPPKRRTDPEPSSPGTTAQPRHRGAVSASGSRVDCATSRRLPCLISPPSPTSH